MRHLKQYLHFLCYILAADTLIRHGYGHEDTYNI